MSDYKHTYWVRLPHPEVAWDHRERAKFEATTYCVWIGARNEGELIVKASLVGTRYTQAGRLAKRNAHAEVPVPHEDVPEWVWVDVHRQIREVAHRTARFYELARNAIIEAEVGE